MTGRKRLILIVVISALCILMHRSHHIGYAHPTIEVNVDVTNVKNLYGIDLKICYTTESLDLVEATPKPAWSNSIVVCNEIDENEGIYRLVMVGVYPAAPFTGNTTLVTLTFLPTCSSEYAFWLTQVKMTDIHGNPLPYKIEGCTIQGTEPLTAPKHDIAVVTVVGYPRSAFQGDPVYIWAVVENKGDFPETFEVVVYADQALDTIGDEITVGTKTVLNLPAGAIETVSFIWDTTGAPYGSYYISAKVSTVLGETEVYAKDNFLIAAEYIGGIYPKPHLRQMFNVINNASFISLWLSFIAASLLSAKKYWCL